MLPDTTSQIATGDGPGIGLLHRRIPLTQHIGLNPDVPDESVFQRGAVMDMDLCRSSAVHNVMVTLWGIHTKHIRHDKNACIVPLNHFWKITCACAQHTCAQHT